MPDERDIAIENLRQWNETHDCLCHQLVDIADKRDCPFHNEQNQQEYKKLCKALFDAAQGR